MKISCSGELFSNVFRVISENLPEKKANEVSIYDDIKLKTDKDNLILSSDNETLTIFAFIKAAIYKDGESFINGRILKEYLSTVKDELIIEKPIEDQNIIKFSNNLEASVEITTTLGKTRHLKIDLVNPTKIKIQSSSFKKILKQSIFIIPTNLQDETAKCIILDVNKNNKKISSISFEKFRIVMSTDNLIEANKDGVCIIPYKTAKILIDALPDNNDTVLIEFDNNYINIEFNEFIMNGVLIQRDVLNYKSILERIPKNSIVFEKNKMLNSLNTISKIVKEDRIEYSDFIVKNGELILNVNSNIIKNFVDKIPIKLIGEDITFRINRSYIEDFLRNIKEDVASLDFESPNQPLFLRSFKNGKVSNDFIYMFMPIRYIRKI